MYTIYYTTQPAERNTSFDQYHSVRDNNKNNNNNNNNDDVLGRRKKKYVIIVK